jgi:hypothetical protein
MPVGEVQGFGGKPQALRCTSVPMKKPPEREA